MIKIRLSRHGAKKRPFYEIVVANARAPRDGKFLEKVGYYNPVLSQDNPQRISINEELVRHWLSVGAQPTPRVTLLLSKKGLVPAPKFSERPLKSQPKKKAQERLKAQQAA